MIRISTHRIDGGDAALHAELYLPGAEKGAPPYAAALICHGLTSSSAEVREAAVALARRGLAAMPFDFRGHGRSEGVCDRSQHLDVLAALRYLQRLPQVDGTRLAVVGHSSGARAAVLAAGVTSRIAAVVSLSLAPDGLAQEMAQMAKVLKPQNGSAARFKAVARLLYRGARSGPRRALQLAVLLTRLPRLRIDWAKMAAGWAEVSLTQALSAMAPRPVLFVHCQGDWATPPAASIAAFHAYRGPRELWLEPGGFHSTPLHSRGLRERWADWLYRRLCDSAPAGA